MIAYLIRRILYAVPILIGVNLLTFALFFVVNTPDDMARMQLGIKRVTPEAIEKWKQQRGYDKPLLINSAAGGADKFTDTIFWQKSASMFAFDFGYSDDGRSISREIATRMGPSLAIALPTFLIGLVTSMTGLPAKFAAPARRSTSVAAVPLTASTTSSPNFAASAKLPMRPSGCFTIHSASLAGVRVPIVTSWPCLRKPPASAFATSPDPRIPIFMKFSFSKPPAGMAEGATPLRHWLCRR